MYNNDLEKRPKFRVKSLEGKEYIIHSNTYKEGDSVKGQKNLKCYNLDEEQYNAFIKQYYYNICIVDTEVWKNCCRGIYERYVVLRRQNLQTGLDTMLVSFNKLVTFCRLHKLECPEELLCDKIASKQVIISRNTSGLSNETIKVNAEVTGKYAWNYVMKRMLKEYTEEEFYEICRTHSEPYDASKCQLHYFNIQSNTILKFEHCYKYDIHKAYLSILSILFPRCSSMWNGLAYKGKKDKSFKNIANFFTGDFVHALQYGWSKEDLSGTYNYIVHRIRDKVINMWNKLDGTAVYSNTDSICVMNPRNIIADSNKLGDFGLEYAGTVYSYARSTIDSSPYFVFEFGKDVKGNIPISLRKDISLKDGKVLSFKRKKVFQDGAYLYEDIENLKTEYIKEIKDYGK